MTCGACGTANPAGTEFCEVCGMTLGAPARGKTAMAAPLDAARKSRTLYDPGPAKPEPSPSDVFANPAPPRAAFDPQDPFKSSIVSNAPPAPAAKPVVAAKPAPRRQATVLQGPAPEAKDITGVLCVYQGGDVRLVPLASGRTGLGRDAGSDICIDDTNISGSHAFIYMRESGVSFIDVSRNGSIVDGIPLMGEDAPLHHGSVIELGQTRCILLVVPPESLTP
ncbi:MAG: hypothetical protein ACJATT_004199 [Myxococcota bacterium]